MHKHLSYKILIITATLQITTAACMAWYEVSGILIKRFRQYGYLKASVTNMVLDRNSTNSINDKVDGLV